MTESEKIATAIKKQYGEYLTQREFMQAAGISSRTAYLATKNGLVPFRKEQDGPIGYYCIKAEDVAFYIEARAQRKSTVPSPEKMSLLNTILSGDPDMLTIKQASAITGIHKNCITKWIHNGSIKSYRYHKYMLIPKQELIRYIASPIYWNARTKGIQRKALRMTMLWLETQRLNAKEETNNEDNKRSDR